MNPGDFRHLVDIVGPGAQTPDGAGGYTEGADVTVLSQVWARIEGLTGTEQLRAQQTVSQASHRVTLREWSGAVTPAMRVIFETRTFHIVAPPADPEEKRERLELLCREDF
jgi:SPP1 family predicted phage head-tail adaptor